MEQQAQKEIRKRTFWWPDTNTKEGVAEAVFAGGIAAFWVCLGRLVNVAYLTFSGETYKSRDKLVIVFGIAAIAAAFLAWRIWKHSGHVSATILLIWVLFIAGVKLTSGLGVSGLTAIGMVLFAIHGVRGTYVVNARAKRGPIDDDKVRQLLGK